MLSYLYWTHTGLFKRFSSTTELTIFPEIIQTTIWVLISSRHDLTTSNVTEDSPVRY